MQRFSVVAATAKIPFSILRHRWNECYAFGLSSVFLSAATDVVFDIAAAAAVVHPLPLWPLAPADPPTWPQLPSKQFCGVPSRWFPSASVL